ncbi:MAG: hypothetical protein EAZ76_12565 [Nostocales cyanobacterium]|nr:MAG: hypothetical protein EAZ87_16180 [Nostocales cyanobacterium]TAF13039.1 MAG: hypothetical protein EAZ76_12565 [Nostocales cyanobacterium]
MTSLSILSIDEIKTLAENPQTPSVSIYLPTKKAGAEIRQNPIRFKNLIREAQENLEAMGIRHTEAVDFLQPAMELDQDNFWEHQDQGLVIFSSPHLFRYYCLPTDFPELVVVSEQFHLKPLLHFINNEGKFFVLSLSQNNVKFFVGSAHHINEIKLENIPHTLQETILEDEFQKGVQHRVGIVRGGATAAEHPGSFHGQGSPDREKINKDILNWFHIINKELTKQLITEKAPLILAGVEHLVGIYQQANTYPFLLSESIVGNPEFLTNEQLHQQGWLIVSPLFHQDQTIAIKRYQQLAGEGRETAVSDIKTIITAAYYQRVDSLFVAVDQQVWGKFDSENLTVNLHPKPEPDDEDMLDFAAVHTFLNGGKVYTLTSEEMPNGSKVAAIFRY